MAPLPPVTAIVKLDHIFTYGADTNIMCHLYFHYTSAPPTSVELTNWASSAGTAWTANMKSLQASTCTLNELIATDLATPTTQSGVANPQIAGGIASSDMTAATCAMVNLHIGRRYRGGHPRVYWPLGGAADLAAPNQWSTSWIGAFNTGFTAYVDALLNQASPALTCDTLANVSYRSGNAARPTPIWDPVLSFALNQIPGTQRRRMRP
jgi:hypothetical protein